MLREGRICSFSRSLCCRRTRHLSYSSRTSLNPRGTAHSADSIFLRTTIPGFKSSTLRFSRSLCPLWLVHAARKTKTKPSVLHSLATSNKQRNGVSKALLGLKFVVTYNTATRPVRFTVPGKRISGKSRSVDVTIARCTSGPQLS
jgi:hypothetical protein